MNVKGFGNIDFFAWQENESDVLSIIECGHGGIGNALAGSLPGGVFHRMELCVKNKDDNAGSSPAVRSQIKKGENMQYLRIERTQVVNVPILKKLTPELLEKVRNHEVFEDDDVFDWENEDIIDSDHTLIELRD